MTKTQTRAGLVAACLLFWGSAALAASPEQILNFRPKQDVAVSTPTPQEVNTCRVSWTPNSIGGGTWLLLDPQGRPLRRFVDNKGDKKPHIWSYFRDGVEVYREIDADLDGEPDQYRWLNSGGMKWGVDLNKDHKIDAWKMISAEQVSQEIVQAKLYGGAKGHVPLVAEREVRLMVPRGTREKIIARVVYSGPVPAPVRQGQKIGMLKVWRGDFLVLEVPLQSAENVAIGSMPRRAFDAASELVLGFFRAGLQRL